MGKKKKGKKEKVPEDPYKDYLRLWMVCETEGSDVRLPVFLPKSYCILGDVFTMAVYGMFDVLLRYLFGVLFVGEGFLFSSFIGQFIGL